MPRAAGGRPGRGGSREKGGFAATVAAESAAEVERLIGRGVADGADFEAVAERLNADRSDEKGPRRPCACGAQARYGGRRRTIFTTALGEIELERAWYHCEKCGAGFSPRDRALGLEGSSLSPAALRMTGLAAARVSFAESGELLRELAGLDIDAKLAERQAEALGREIADDERHVVEGGCKNIVASRLKRGGMHWTVAGANAIMALRCAILSNRFDDFWERRASGR